MINTVSRLRLATMGFAGALLLAVVASLLCALAATFLIHIGVSFKENLVFSICIAAVATVFIASGRLLLRGQAQPSRGRFLLMLALAAVLSAVLGKLLATYVLGRPITFSTALHSDHIIAVIVLSLLAGFSATLHYRHRARLAKRQAHDAVIEQQAAQAQLQILQAQIKPQLLFKTLDQLQTLISVEPLRAQQMLDQLVHYLRAMLATSRSAQTTLEKEFELIQAYLGLMSLRMGLRLTYTLHLPDQLKRLPIAPMLLQPLVENAIRHGLEPKLDGGDCTVRVTTHEALLIISVFDSGVGLSAQAAYNKPGGPHQGLDNIRAHLDALYGPLAELTLTHNIPAGTVAQITIPLKALRSQ